MNYPRLRLAPSGLLTLVHVRPVRVPADIRVRPLPSGTDRRMRNGPIQTDSLTLVLLRAITYRLPGVPGAGPLPMRPACG